MNRTKNLRMGWYLMKQVEKNVNGEYTCVHYKFFSDLLYSHSITELLH